MKISEETLLDLQQLLTNDNYIKSYEITNKITELTNGIKVRKAINMLRQKSTPIISSSNGYRLAKNKEEVMKCVIELKNRILSIQKAVDGLEKYNYGKLL